MHAFSGVFEQAGNLFVQLPHSQTLSWSTYVNVFSHQFWAGLAVVAALAGAGLAVLLRKETTRAGLAEETFGTVMLAMGECIDRYCKYEAYTNLVQLVCFSFTNIY